MDIKEYLERNLPNVNFNILPQLFEEEGIELTEEIVEYLKTTPWNTNWNVFGSLGRSEKLPKIIRITGYGEDESIISDDSDLKTAQEIYNWCETHSEYNNNSTRRIATDIEFYISGVKADPMDAENITPAPSWSAYAGDMYITIGQNGTILCYYDN